MSETHESNCIIILLDEDEAVTLPDSYCIARNTDDTDLYIDVDSAKDLEIWQEIAATHPAIEEAGNKYRIICIRQ